VGDRSRPGGDREPRKFFEELRGQLIAHAAHEFGLDAPAGDGYTRRTHLRAAWKSTGRKPAELDGPALPAPLAHAWDWYQELDAARSGSGFGPNPVGYVELQAWAQLTGTRPSLFELECLRALDETFFAVWADTRKRKER
jgi:hypothetical protein